MKTDSKTSFTGGVKNRFFGIVALFTCVALCVLFTACGGGGGGGGASGGANDSSLPWGGAKTLKIDINGLLGSSRASSRPSLDWTKIDLKVYINDEVVYDESIQAGNNDDIIIKNVKPGSTARATAAIWVQGEAESRDAASDTITVTAGTNSLTLYVPYNITFNINAAYPPTAPAGGNFAEFEGGVDTYTGTYTTRSFKAPEPTITNNAYTHYYIAGWVDAITNEAFTPGTTKGDRTVNAVWKGNIKYTQAYYESLSAPATFPVNTLEQFMDLVELSKTKDFYNMVIKINTNLSLPANFEGFGPNAYDANFSFKGTIDGEGEDGVRHPIQIATVSTNTDVAGFVTYLDGTVKNITLTGTMSATAESCGGIVGCNSTGFVENCANKATITNTQDYSFTGGIAGSNGGQIKRSYNDGTVTGNGIGTIYVGGITALNNYGTITDVYNNKGVAGGSGATTSYIGYLLGNTMYGSLTNAYTTGTISGDAKYVCAWLSSTTLTKVYRPDESHDIEAVNNSSDVYLNSSFMAGTFPSSDGWVWDADAGLPKFSF